MSKWTILHFSGFKRICFAYLFPRADVAVILKTLLLRWFSGFSGVPLAVLISASVTLISFSISAPRCALRSQPDWVVNSNLHNFSHCVPFAQYKPVKGIISRNTKFIEHGLYFNINSYKLNIEYEIVKLQDLINIGPGHWLDRNICLYTRFYNIDGAHRQSYKSGYKDRYFGLVTG